MSNREIFLLVVLAGAGALYWYSTTSSGQSALQTVSDSLGGALVNRGIRNRNPGNIRNNGIAWNNSYSTQAACEAAGRVWDPDFVVFYNFTDGERALGHVLTSYANEYGINTVSGVISRYAPSTENDTATYTNNVADWLGVSPDTIIDISQVLPQLAQGIMRQETGYSEDPNILANAVYS